MFSDEPHYVDDCFNDTLMPASVDNVKRIQSKIDALEAQKFANFEKALTRAFELFRKVSETMKHAGV
ncbi:voltage-dependent calcium channel alpha-2/delta, invertebrate [Elysia marginata]|uniref:Voltage-dependent calcium channel alpha-2/delta, invertebrate n=1 Tax=Elysia marginata TaxID=1093978 RepID=A0AAV4GPW3_9GAST|nr:voltage-dependent calcium channel alpha-2/delta, invertebrate [Elysia marginata]